MQLVPRSYLFVPGDRPDRFGKALTSGADAIVLDLEDGVSAEAKDKARIAIGRWLEGAQAQDARAVIAVRVNSPGSDGFTRDLDLCRHPRVRAVLVPKAESAASLQPVADAAPQAALLPLVETASGLSALGELGAAASVQRLVFGALDLALDLNLAVDESADQAELASFRSQLVLASRLASLAPPG